MENSWELSDVDAVNATLVIFAGVVVILIVAAQSATALAVLVALASLAWALAYGLVVSTGLYALVTNKLPRRAFSCGRLSLAVFITAIFWSALIIVIVIWQNPSRLPSETSGIRAGVGDGQDRARRVAEHVLADGSQHPGYPVAGRQDNELGICCLDRKARPGRSATTRYSTCSAPTPSASLTASRRRSSATARSS